MAVFRTYLQHLIRIFPRPYQFFLLSSIRFCSLIGCFLQCDLMTMGLVRTLFLAPRAQLLSSYALVLLSKIISPSKAQGACPFHPVSSVVVVKQTIHIITSVLHDTTFEVNRDLTITVDNAPTNLDLMTTFFSESTMPRKADP